MQLENQESLYSGRGVPTAAQTIEKGGLLVVEHLKLTCTVSRILHLLQYLVFVLSEVEALNHLGQHLGVVSDLVRKKYCRYSNKRPRGRGGLLSEPFHAIPISII
jgi:hypothetical protein